MNDVEQRAAAAEFAARWKGRGYEKGETHVFWIELLRSVLGVADAERRILFEEQVKLDNTSFLDARIPESGVLIEQKGVHINLEAKARQSDGSVLTPLEQARRYVVGLPVSQHPRYIVVCNFATFQIYDCEKQDVQLIQLEELPQEYHRLGFLIDATKELRNKEMEVSLQAGELVGRLYDALLHQYHDPSSPETLHSLNALCVRLVFCLYAEDAGIFGERNMFHDYLRSHQSDARRSLKDLFQVLDTRPEERDPYMDADLAAFPYVNGGLFADDDTVIPRLTDDILELILQRASAEFDWSKISPTIFGAVFESTLNPETRRSGGMHYTSIENIHKVIDPLFLDALRKELEDIRSIAVARTRMQKLKAFQNKLSQLTFLDPACGSGNFLTETYLSIRRLENVVISLLNKGQGVFLLDDKNPIQVSIRQFYGIEINDFAVTVARTALWIAESQMMRETEAIVRTNLDFLPLKSYVHVIEGNALRMDWASVVAKEKLNYIIGNPPFIGHQCRTKEQAEELALVCDKIPKGGKLDYVCGWFCKAAAYMQNTSIQTALVATNSICQGEAVGILWKPLFEQGVEIQFAHTSFSWTSESRNAATVHCVIVGFTMHPIPGRKTLYCGDTVLAATHINGYLVDAPAVYIQSRGTPLTAALPPMAKGSQPTDGGQLFLNEEERQQLIEQHPEANAWVRLFLGATELINGKKRYCLWLKGVSPAKYRHIAFIMQRLKRVAELRLQSPTASVRRDAEIPMLFTQIRQPDTEYLAVPEVSSERRKYVPMGFLTPDIICGNSLQLIPDATLYMFGVLTSAAHMSWMKTVCGRLEMRYRYTPAIYNNFPWPTPTPAQRENIEKTAQEILQARALYPDSSLADLYDESTMPPELRRAHQRNDKAVMQAYGFSPDIPESALIAELMKRYQSLSTNK